MPAAKIPIDEAERLAALHSYNILDTACEDAFDNIAHLAAELTGSPISLISLVDADRQWFKARVGLEQTETPRAESFCAHAILSPGEPLVVADATLDPRFSDNPYVQAPDGVRFYAGVPLVNPEGAALGTLCVVDGTPREMSEAQRQIMRRLAETVVTTLELRRAMNRVRDLALADPLTGIGNRAALIDALERAIAHQKRHGDGFALLYLDLDGFKNVNDSLGHAAGDDVLREVAATLVATLRREDVSARIGGDEFAAILVGDVKKAKMAAERIRAAIEQGMAARDWPVTASVGAASFTGVPQSADAALAEADALMYAAKRAGKNRISHTVLTDDEADALDGAPPSEG
jgi:diguanylate cyclase (GGDEF)-like protein